MVDGIVAARPDWCVPAALETVCHLLGISGSDQNAFAEHLTIIPADELTDHSRWGAQLKSSTINDVFVQMDLPLREDYYSANLFLDEYFLVDELVRMLKNGYSIICGYNYSVLFGDGNDTFNHVSVVLGVVNDGREIKIFDPGPTRAGNKIVNAARLFDAIKAARDGIWCIHPIHK